MEGELTELIRSREDAKTRSRSALEGTVSLDMEDVLRRQRFINVLYQRMAAKQDEIRRFQTEVDKVSGDYREARRRLKAVQKVRERRKREFDYQAARAECKELDEVGQVYHQRRAAEIRSSGGE